MIRTLRLGGQVSISDLTHVDEYAAHLGHADVWVGGDSTAELTATFEVTSPASSDPDGR